MSKYGLYNLSLFAIDLGGLMILYSIWIGVKLVL